MTNRKIIINDVEFDTAEIVELLTQDKKIEAIKLIFDRTNIALKEAKDLIDNIQKGNYESLSNPIKTSNRERVVINKKDNEIVVTYFAMKDMSIL